MRLFSACVDSSSWRVDLQVDQPRAEQAEREQHERGRGDSRRRKRAARARRSSVRSSPPSRASAAPLPSGRPAREAGARARGDGSSQRPILVRIGRAALRRQQQPASRPATAAPRTTGASSSSQPGNMPPAIMRTTSETACAAKNSGRICSACAGTAEPQQAAVDRDREEAEQRVGQRVLAEHARRRARPSAGRSKKATPTPTRRGWCTFQNTSTSASRSGIAGSRPSGSRLSANATQQRAPRRTAG